MKPRTPRQKSCRVCARRFVPLRPFQVACTIGCAIAYAEAERRRAERRAAKAERKEDQIKRESLKTRAEYMREAQAAWNRYVRMRDFGKPCASCGRIVEQKRGGTIDCSHYRSVGAAPHLRFHLHNAAAACTICNRHLGGNVAALRQGLIARFGLKKIEALEANNEARKFDKSYLIRVKRIFTKKANRAAARREHEQ